jgi:dipeptidyl aminopeptidase/acylaminoacyl peptidase
MLAPTRKPPHYLAILAILCCSLTTTAKAKHRVTFDDLGKSQMVVNMQLSPDGGTLAYAITDPSQYPAANGGLWLVALRQGSTPRKVADGVLPTWSPDGRKIVFYSGGRGGFQLWTLDVASGRSEAITELPGGIDPDPVTRITGDRYDALAVSWSPDSTRLVFASRIAVRAAGREKAPNEKQSPAASLLGSPGAPLVLTTMTPPEWTISGIFSHAYGDTSLFAAWEKDKNASPAAVLAPVERIGQLFVVDLRTKKTQQLTKDEGGYFNPHWSPDGTTIVSSSSNGIPLLLLGRSGVKTTIYAIDPETGGKKLLWTDSSGDKRLPAWSPHGKSVAYLAGAYSGWQSLFLIPSRGEQPVNLTAKLDRYVYDFQWSPDGNSIFVLIRDGLSTPILSINVHTGTVETITGSDVASRNHMTASHTGVVAWQQSDGSSDNVIRVWSATTHFSYPLVDLNPQVSEWELGAQEPVRWTNSRGDEIEGILIKPVGYRSNERYPLIVDCYPGEPNSFRSSALGGNQAWASKGYVVFIPSGARAPHSWMSPFTTAAYGKAGKGPKGWEITTDDILSGVDELIRRGVADPDRMGLYGFSNGGGIVEQLVTRTNRFKCAVAYAGATSADWSRDFFLTTANSWIPVVAGVTPWENPQAYIELSAVYRLHYVTTPMLLADGDRDGGFLLNTVEIYNGLRYLGRDVTFLRYPDQGHVFTGAALRDLWERENAFFDGYLKPEPPMN